MPFLVKGGITIDGVQLNTDPSTYEPANWEKRFSETMHIGGGRTIQDFGTFMRDNAVRLQSGDNNPIEESVMTSLHTRFRTKGATFVFTDWLGNTFTVFIKEFVPIPLKKGRDGSVPAGGTLSLYTYMMELRVLVITNFFGTPYTGF